MFAVFAIFQDELEARKLLKVFFLQPKLYLDILWNVFFLFADKKKYVWHYVRSFSLKSYKHVQTSPIDYARLHETRKTTTTTNNKYNNYHGVELRYEAILSFFLFYSLY